MKNKSTLISTIIVKEHFDIDMKSDLFPSVDHTEKNKEGSTETYKYYVNGRTVICFVKDDRGHRGKGVALCNEKDNFNYSFGCNLAELRARRDMFDRAIEKLILS